MIYTNTHPTEDCKFVAVWENPKGIWSSTLEMINGDLFEYDERGDRIFKDKMENPHWPHNCSASNHSYKYFIFEEGAEDNGLESKHER